MKKRAMLMCWLAVIFTAVVVGSGWAQEVKVISDIPAGQYGWLKLTSRFSEAGVEKKIRETGLVPYFHKEPVLVDTQHPTSGRWFIGWVPANTKFLCELQQGQGGDLYTPKLIAICGNAVRGIKFLVAQPPEQQPGEEVQTQGEDRRPIIVNIYNNTNTTTTAPSQYSPSQNYPVQSQCQGCPPQANCYSQQGCSPPQGYNYDEYNQPSSWLPPLSFEFDFGRGVGYQDYQGYDRGRGYDRGGRQGYNRGRQNYQPRQHYQPRRQPRQPTRYCPTGSGRGRGGGGRSGGGGGNGPARR